LRAMRDRGDTRESGAWRRTHPCPRCCRTTTRRARNAC
jgi:hypothetical protein